MEEIFYTKDNYWFSIENDVATIGITNFILDEIDIINFIELPTIGSVCNKTVIQIKITYIITALPHALLLLNTSY